MEKIQWLRNLNMTQQSTSDGYAIKVKFYEETSGLAKLASGLFGNTVNLSVVSDGWFSSRQGTGDAAAAYLPRSGNAGAYRGFRGNTLVVEIDASYREIVHEAFHKIALGGSDGHSIWRNSVMFGSNTPQNEGSHLLRVGEVKQIINEFSKINSKKYWPF